MTAVRPPVWPSVQPASTGGAGNARTAAQKAFFEAALGKATGAQPQPAPAPAVRAETVPQPAAQPVRNTTFTQPTEQPQKVLRPGSLLDIRV